MGRPVRAGTPPATEASGLILDAVKVTTVVVAHNGGLYLPRTLAAVASQTRPADAVLAVDTGSDDDSLNVLERTLGRGSVISQSSARGGFGAAVKAALDHFAPAAGAAGAAAEREWLWLLHDDSAPAPDALAELLTAIERAPSVTVAGCKQLDWDEPRKLLDVGLSTSRWAERLTLIDFDEQDQGQHDGRSDMVAVNSAGMLIRRDVWDQLGGFDPALPGSGDDVDFCWRSRLAGNRVVVVPQARMFHVSHRPHSLGTPAAARKAEVHLRLKHAAWWQVPFVAVGALMGGIFRLMAGFFVKDPGHGARQFLATCAALLRPLAVVRARSAAARTRRLSRSVMKNLQTPRREVWSHRRSLVESLLAQELSEDDTEAGAADGQIPSGDASDDFAALATTDRRWSGTGALVSAGLLLVAALVSLYRLVGAEAVAGGALLPLSATLGDIWHNASTWWIGVGAGLPGHGDPFDYVLWLLAAAGFGHGSRAVAWLLVLALPLAGLGAWFATGALTRLRWPRFGAALVWAAAPALQIAIGQGRLGALLAHVLIPWVALGFIRSVGGAVRRGRADDSAGTPSAVLRGRNHRSASPAAPARPGTGGTPSWTAAAAAGLVLAAVTASAPVLLVPAVIVAVLATVFLGRRGRTLWWALLPSLALFLPFVISTLANPRAVFADPGVPLAYVNAPVWQQLLGQPVSIAAGAGVGSVPLLSAGGFPWGLVAMLIVGGPVLLLALVGLLLPGRRPGLVRALWLTAVLGLATGYACGAVAVALGGTSLVTPFSGPAVSVTAFALLAAAVLGLDGLIRRAQAPAGTRAHRARRITATAVSVALLLAPAASLTLWTVGNLVQNTGAAQASADQDPAQGPDGGLAQQSSVDAGSQGDLTAKTVPATGQYGVPALIRPSAARTLPATATDGGNGPDRSRTLVISMNADGSVSAALMRGAGTTLDSLSTIAAARGITGEPGAETVAADDDVTTAVRKSVATIIAGTGVDPRPELSRLGVGFVVLQHGDTAAELMANQIEAVPGLATVGPTDVGWLWRVTPAGAKSAQAPAGGARARIVNAAGTTLSSLPSDVTDADGVIPAGGDDRLLVLSERSDAGWTASIDGRKLTSVAAGWAQAFTLPAAGGHLEVRYERPWSTFWSIVQIVVLGLTVLMAAPMPARRQRIPAGNRGGRPAPGSPRAPSARPQGRTAAEPSEESAREESPQMAGNHG